MLNFASFFLFLRNESLKNILFPSTCIICGKINSNNICEKCEKRIKRYEKIKHIRR